MSRVRTWARRFVARLADHFTTGLIITEKKEKSVNLAENQSNYLFLFMMSEEFPAITDLPETIDNNYLKHKRQENVMEKEQGKDGLQIYASHYGIYFHAR